MSSLSTCYAGLFRLRPLQDAGTGVRGEDAMVRGEDAMADAGPGEIAEMTVSLTR